MSQATIRSLEILDLGTPWPQLRTVCVGGARSADGLLGSGLGGAGDLLTIALETEPLHVETSVLMSGELQPVRVVLNPRMLGSLLRYFDVPPTHWQTVTQLERHTQGAIADLVHGIRSSFAQGRWRHRPLNLQLVIRDPMILVLEPPPLLGPSYPTSAMPTSPTSVSSNDFDGAGEVEFRSEGEDDDAFPSTHAGAAASVERLTPDGEIEQLRPDEGFGPMLEFSIGAALDPKPMPAPGTEAESRSPRAFFPGPQACYIWKRNPRLRSRRAATRKVKGGPLKC